MAADMKLHAAEPADTGRAITFSDSVFAIVITLLVIDLRTPPYEAGQLLQALLAQWPTYVAYLASYMYIAVVWLNHKYAFRRIALADRGLHWANLGVLFTTALLPFPTGVLADAFQHGSPADEHVAIALYALIGALLCLAWLVFFRYLAYHPHLLERHVPGDFFHGETRRAWLGILLYLAAFVFGWFTQPWVALALFVILPVFYGITSHGLHEIGRVLPRLRSKQRNGEAREQHR
jgi:uncharacterized membrane protein